MENLILEIEEKISKINNPTFAKANHIFYLIQIKRNMAGNYNGSTTIYIDVKNFIQVYVKSIENRDSGYDLLKLEKIDKAIDCINFIEQRYALYEYAYRVLKINGFENECDSLKLKINRLRTLKLKSEKRYVKSFIHKWSYDLKSILITIIVLFIINGVIFLPAPVGWMQVYNINYNTFSAEFLSNHYLNLLGYVTGIEDTLEVTTSSIRGLLLLIFIKFIYILFIGNFLLEKIKAIFKSN